MTNANTIASEIVQIELQDARNDLGMMTWYYDTATVIGETKGLTAAAVGKSLARDFRYSDSQVKSTVKNLQNRIGEVKAIVKRAKFDGLEFWSFVDGINDERADEGKSALYSVQGVYNGYCKRPVVKADEVTEEATEVVADDDATAGTGDVLSSILGMIGSLSADDVTVVNMALAAHMDSLQAQTVNA